MAGGNPTIRQWPALFLVPAIALGPATARGASDPFPGVAAAYILRTNGSTTWSHRSNSRLPPASLTKIMTALLVLEWGELDRVVTVKTHAARETGSRIGLRSGDRLKARDLLAATLLASANDACRALAEEVGGNEPSFVDMMNRRAMQLGLRDTHFVNACGHQHPQHYSSAEDLARLGETAMKNRIFSALAATVAMRISTVCGTRTFRLENRNELIGRYQGAIGVKTGYTGKAGPCLVAVAERQGNRVLLVLLNARDRWWQSVAMLDRAFAEAQPAVAGAHQ